MARNSSILILTTLFLLLGLTLFGEEVLPSGGEDLGYQKILREGWRFYWDELIPPDEMDKAGPGEPLVPTNWVNQGYPPFGKATYHYRVEAPAGRNFSELFPLGAGLRFKSTYSALRCYVNGVVVGQTGDPDDPGRRGGSNIRRSSYTFSLPPGTETLDIVLHVANSRYGMGAGLYNAPLLAPAGEVSRLREGQIFRDSLIAGIFLFMGLYHLILWFFRREDKAPLFLGFFTLFITLRHFSTAGEKMIYVLFPQFPFSLWIAILVIILFPLMPLYLSFIHRLFPRQSFPRLYKAAMIISLIYLVGAFVRLPYNTAPLYYPFFLLLVVLTLVILFRALRAGEEGALLIVGGSVMLLAAVIHDILVDSAVIHGGYLLSWGLFAFVFLQSVVLARIFSANFFKVQRLSRDLDRANQDLQNLDHLKDQFLANTSHELRTPLNGIIGLAEVLRDEALGPLSEDQKKNLHLIVVSGRRLYNQVNDLLDFSQIKENKLSIQCQSLQFSSVAQVVCALVSHSEGKSSQVSVKMELPENLPPVRADEQRLDQILHNLLNNALKFTREGTITLAARIVDKRLRVEVRDTGIGIPPEKQEEIFTPFRQVDGSASREFGGVGLGLSITRSLVELHEGELGVESTPGEGSIFWFTLPFASAADGAVMTQYLPVQGASRSLSSTGIARQERAEALSGKGAGEPAEEGSIFHLPRAEKTGKIKALAVDDESTNLKVLSQQLLLSGFEVQSARDGQEALDIMESGFHPDVVISDVMMPKITGFDLTERIRQTHSPAELPVILLTAKSQTETIVHGFGVGANDYLTKPFSRDEMMARVTTHTALARLNRSYKRFIPQGFLLALGKENITDFALGDQKETSLAILFSDIKGFTSLSEKMSPQENFNFINSYLSRFGPLIRSRGGFVDKYIGDEIMALFPQNKRGQDEPATRRRALSTAVLMRRELQDYNRERGQAGYEPVEFGIGIHQGKVIMGIVGESERMDTTVISDVVNTASRLERLTRELETPLLFTQPVLEGALPSNTGQIEGIDGYVCALGRFLFRGKEESQEVWEWLHPQENPRHVRRIEQIPRFVEARSLFDQRNFTDALSLLEDLLQELPGEPVYQMYQQLCRRALKEPNRADWNVLN